MCSIAGSFESEKTRQMLEKMIHRSPDGIKVSKIASLTKYSIGMGRLSIIDLKSDNLCLYEENGCYLAFNGEIYNYRELRKELKKKHEFKTDSDTEVLFKAWKEWGIACLDRFNGMFAFAIYDGTKVFFARDIAGEKPFYYNPNQFSFASEAKALDFDCVELPPAHFGFYLLESGTLTIEPYWKPVKRDISVATAEEELESLLEDSVRLRTNSDVPYALYYSGGIDSSLIATFHNFEHTFTYEDGDYREEFLKIFPKILYHLDYPVSSFSPFGLWKLAEMASKKVKVVLSGEGADELFGGYVRYVQPHFNYLAQKEFSSYKSMFEPAQSVGEQGWNEFNGNMQELLRMGDRMSSAFGIENRCPFLDKRIIEFAYSLPDELKIKGLETKVILRRILERRNPGYKHVEKKGLYCSIPSWLGESNPLSKDKYKDYQFKLWKELVLSQPIGQCTNSVQK